MAEKEKYLRRYYESFKKHREKFRQEHGISPETNETGSSSFYCILRCLIPLADHKRSAYDLQITSLSKVYMNVLQLPEDSRDAKRLRGRTKGSYADLVYSVLLPRCNSAPSKLTLRQVHDMLDTIAANDRRTTEKVLTNIAEIASAKEQMWFIRLLLKSMCLGVGEQRIFGVLHPDAKQQYQRCTNLSTVCCRLADAQTSGTTFNINAVIEPFQMVRPMLCEVFPGNIEPMMAADVLYMETKMDGERFQLHYANGRFKYISRNDIDYTHSFGENYSTGKLTPQLKNLLPIGMESIIIDGEMMVWDTQQQRFRHKGENTDVKHLSSNSSWQPCFVAYDLLYYNGDSLLDMPYVRRTLKLSLVLKEQLGVLQVMKPAKVSSIEEFKRMFQQALDSNEEGVVLKKQNSVYRPGMRHGGGWYKVKADYIQGLTTEFDLLIMGGFYNHARSFIESFLVGVLKLKSPQQFELYSVGKVANVISQRVILNESLRPYWRQMSSEPPPMWYRYAPAVPEGRPDVWIEPKNSAILQIKAADLAPSAAFYLSKALHFPRIELWRKDKAWNECMLLAEYLQLSQGKNGIKKINKRELRLEDFTTENKRHKLTPAAKRKLGISSYEKRFDAKDIQQTSRILEGFSFCILSACLKKRCTPADLKALVARNGGEIIENPIYDNPKCLSVAGDITFYVKAMQKSRLGNVVSMQWLLRTCEKQEVLLAPKDLICMTKDLEEQFSGSYDKYGDSYTNYVTAEELQELLDGMPDDELDGKDLMPAELKALEDMIYKNKSPNFYRNYYACFFENDPRTQLARMLFQWRGGSCLDVTTKSTALHDVDFVFLNAKRANETDFKVWLQEHFSDYLHTLQTVDIGWILDSHTAKHKLDVCEYSWHNF